MPRVTFETDNTMFQSALFWGVSRVGKTALCATFPRPAFITSAREGGFRTIFNMDRSLWYEPNVVPQIFKVSNMGECVNHLKNDIFPAILKKEIRTIVVELSVYSDDVIASMPQDEKNGWVKYGNLETHINWIDAEVKRLFPNVYLVYNTLAQITDDPKVPGGPMTAGKALMRKLPAKCDIFGYLRIAEEGGKVTRSLHMEPYGSIAAGHRFGARVPGLIKNPTFRKIEDLFLGRATANPDGEVVPKPQSVFLPPLTAAK